MFCYNCGEENPDEAKYCRNCGAVLKEENKAKKVEVIENEGNYQSRQQTTTTSTTSSKSDKDNTWIGCCCLAVIVIFLLSALFGGL